MTPPELLAVIERLALAAGVGLPLVAAVLARMSAIAFLAPGLGERATPMRVRLAAVIALTMIVAPPLAPAFTPALYGPVELAALIGTEALIGLVIGFALRLSIFILQIAGAIIAQHISLSQLFGLGLGHEQETQLSTILIMGGLAVAASSDLHIEIAAALINSYSIFPLGALPAAGDVGEWASRESGAAIGVAFALSAPFTILGFIYSLTLAAMSRAMPQLTSSFVGAPAILFAGLALFAGTASVTIGRWTELLAALIDNPVGSIR